MIQRPQTVLLFVAIVLQISAFWAPVWFYGSVGADTEAVFGAYTHVQEKGADARTTLFLEHTQSVHMALHTAFVALSMVAAAVLAFVIFDFKNRQRQIQTILWTLLIQSVALAALVFYTMRAPEIIMGGEGQGSPQWGFALPVAAILLAWLAARLIRKDENLVRSVDRLR